MLSLIGLMQRMEKKQIEALYWLMLSLNVPVSFKASYPSITELLHKEDARFNSIYLYLRAVLLKVNVETSSVILDKLQETTFSCNDFQWNCLAIICISGFEFIIARHDEIVHKLLSEKLLYLIQYLFKQACMQLIDSLPFIHLILADCCIKSEISSILWAAFQKIQDKIELLAGVSDNIKRKIFELNEISKAGDSLLPEDYQLQFYQPFKKYVPKIENISSERYDFSKMNSIESVQKSRAKRIILLIEYLKVLKILIDRE